MPRHEQDEREKEIAKSVLKEHKDNKGMRTNWDNHWDEIAKYIIPRKDNVFGFANDGRKQGNKLFDSTSVHVNELLASALHGMLTNPSSIWFGLSTGDRELDKDDEVRAWLQDSVLRIIQVLNNSNFQTQIHETYLDLGSLGTAPMMILEDEDTTLRFLSRPIYEFVVAENSKGVVDKVSREYEMTYEQIYEEFGEEAMSDKMMEALKDKPRKKEKVIHLVRPNSDYDPHKLLDKEKGKAYSSIHVFDKQKWLLKIDGFHENPYVVPRWTKMAGEVYGRSPGMKSLADIKMLNAMMKVIIVGAQKVIDPPLVVPDDGFLIPIKTSPGGTNYSRAGSKDKIEPLITGGRIDLGEEVVEKVRERIRQSFFIDQLQLAETGPQMTATEVQQRTEEKLRLLGPILGRLHFELLQPMVDRIFGIMSRKKMFLEAPADIQGKKLEVKFTSQIAKAQRVSESDSFTRVMSIVAPLVEMQPEIMDNVNGDEVLKAAADIFGLPQEVLNSQDEVAEKRQQRAQQQQQMQQQEAQAQEAGTMKDLGQAMGSAEGLAVAQPPAGG